MKIVEPSSGGDDILLLDTPTEYLCGPWVGFYYDDGSGLEWNLFKNCDKDNPYKLMNLKIGNTVTRLTLEFSKGVAGEGVGGDGGGGVGSMKTRISNQLKFRFYADLYFSKVRLYCLYFFSIRNVSNHTFKDIRLYNLYDFDIGGLEHYNWDHACFDDENAAIIQRDESGICAGFSTLDRDLVAHYTAGHPYDFQLDPETHDLDDKILDGPDDLFIGLEFKIGDLDPGQVKIVPIIMVAGETRAEFYEDLRIGKKKAKNLLKIIPKHLSRPDRNVQIKSEKARKMTEARISDKNC
ncbi:MAG: hypothetical protein ACTSWN_01085 [Promethearchaeota archaeon]